MGQHTECTPLQITKALLMWAHWTHPREKYEVACGPKPDDDSHMIEKVAYIRSAGFGAWFLNALDKDCQQKIVDAALTKYGKH